MISFSPLDLKASLLDITTKNVPGNDKQTEFQDTLKSNYQQDNKSATKNTTENTEKMDVVKKQSIKNPKKEIPMVKEDLAGTQEVQSVDQLDNKIITLISEALGMEPEELEEILETLKLEPTDLLNLEHLQSLILALTGNQTMIQLLAQPQEITGPITDLISEISRLSADETVQKVVDSNSIQQQTTEHQSVISNQSEELLSQGQAKIS